MAISWDSFDKIWASTSPLTPYSFSDPNYAQGWNFVGSTPPARQMWDSIQKQNDEKFKYLRDNFGTPNIVTQASQMTDTEKVYVYMGSEAGWNSGHWYYYDEGTSSWADGGVYNSVAFVTDTTLSIAGQPADAKATGDALALKSDLAGCTFTGNVSVNADLSVTGDATIGTDLSVAGDSTLTGNVSASGDIVVVGDISSANLTTSADATIGGDLSVTGTTAFTGNITAGDVTANDVSVANINASNNGTIGGSLSVTGTSSLVGDVTASGDVNATGDVTADNISATTNGTIGGALSVAGASTLTGNVSAGADVVAVGDVSSANIIASNNANIGGNATVTGSVASASLTTTADGTIGGNLSVSGTTTLTGDVSASADLIVAGDSSLTNLSVSGTTALAGTSTAPTPSADDNSTKIATTEYVQTELKPIETKATIDDKRISNIEKLLQGNLYDYQTDSDSKYTKTVPNGAMPYASLEQIGGRTLVWNQLFPQRTISTTSYSGYTISADGTGAFTITVTAETASSNGGVNYTNMNVPSIANHVVALMMDSTLIKVYMKGVGKQSNQVFTYPNMSTYNNISFVFTDLPQGTYTVHPMLTDLTLCYGAGNEPSTVAEFQQTFPAVWYAYNEGTLLSAGVTEVKSVGINIWDEQWENGGYDGSTGVKIGGNYKLRNKNPIPVLPNTTYYFCGDNISYTAWVATYEYDFSGNFIQSSSLSSTNRTFTTGSNTYYLCWNTSDGWGNLVPYTGGICINVSNASINGNYYPYQEHTYPIPAEIRNLEGYGWSVQVYTNNVYSGDVYNQIDFENKKYIQNVGKVTLNGSTSWTWDTGNALAYTIIPNGFIVNTATQHNTYVMSSNPSITSTSWGRRSMYTYTMGMYYGQTRLFCKSENFASADDVKTYFTNNPTDVNYVLETPIETDISAYLSDDNIIEVEAGGSLTFPNSNGDDYRINVPSAETYMVDLQSALGE